MRQLASILLLAVTLTATAAQVWRWKDESGVVHYSDQPVPGAVRVDLGPTVEPPPNTAATATQPAPAAPAPAFRYTSCIVATPANDETFNAVNTIDVSLMIAPSLRPSHRLQVLYDGQVYAAWPASSTSYTLLNVYRGTHTLGVQVMDENGRSVCAGPAISFHVRQPSLFSPARPRPPAPAPAKP